MPLTLTARIVVVAAAAAAFIAAFHLTAQRRSGRSARPAATVAAAARVPAGAVTQLPPARPRLSAVVPVPALRTERVRHVHHPSVAAAPTPAPTPAPAATPAPTVAATPVAAPVVRSTPERSTPSYVGQGFDSRG